MKPRRYAPLGSLLALGFALGSGACVTTSAPTSYARALTLGFGTPTPAARAEAARSFEEGVAAYGREEYARALTLFERAYDQAPAADVLFNMARVHDVMGHAPRAGRYYVAYLHAAREVPPEQRREVDGALARIRPLIAWLTVRATEGFTVDGEPISSLLRGGPIAVWPGVRTVRVGRSAPIAVRTHAGETVALEFDNPDAALLVSSQPTGELRVDTLLTSMRP